MSVLDERTLILGLKDGSTSAFNKIFDSYHKHIYSFCRLLYQSADDASETVQKVFVALWEQRLQIDENKSLSSYLFSIARYMVYQEFRQQVYKKAAIEYFILNSSGSNESTKDDVVYNELKLFLESVIGSLPKRQQEIFKLSRFSGLTYRQIAENLNITENTVDTQIRRALEFVRNKYKFHYR